MDSLWTITFESSYVLTTNARSEHEAEDLEVALMGAIAIQARSFALRPFDRVNQWRTITYSEDWHARNGTDYTRGVSRVRA